MPDKNINNLEFELLLTALTKRYGLDLRGYARTSLLRRLTYFLDTSKLNHLSELIPRLLHDHSFLVNLLSHIAVSVTEFFRDPHVFQKFRHSILPLLRSQPYLKIWHAGCATGEEVYSLAIILHELQMLDKSTIYATDINSEALDKARLGIYDKKELLRSKYNYKRSGGILDLSEYFSERYEYIRFHHYLRNNIIFAQHDLVSDDPFGEINIIFCRNVFIYFDRPLQNSTAQKFASGLIENGILVLGASESLQFVDTAHQFEEISPTYRIYRRKNITPKTKESEPCLST